MTEIALLPVYLYTFFLNIRRGGAKYTLEDSGIFEGRVKRRWRLACPRGNFVRPRVYRVYPETSEDITRQLVKSYGIEGIWGHGVVVTRVFGRRESGPCVATVDVRAALTTCRTDQIWHRPVYGLDEMRFLP